jgi:PAS domain S-box-containing protein
MKNWRVLFALRISLIYAVLGGLWILLSDQALAALITDPAQLTLIQTYKGWFFILITACLLFLLAIREGSQRELTGKSYKDLFDSTTEGIFQSTPSGVFTAVNPAFAHIFGYASPDEMLETVKDISTQIHVNPESRRKFTEALQTQGVIERFEAQNLRKDGSIIWTSTNARIVRDKNGNVLFFEGFVQDITEKKEAEQTLQSREARYRTIVEHASDGIFIADPQGKYLEVNQQACVLLGYSREELLDLSFRDILSADELELRPLKLYELTTGRTIVTERSLQRKDGSLLPVEMSIKMLPDGMIMSIARSISERRLTQEALSRSERKYRALIEKSQEAIALYSTDAKILYQSPAATRILGYPLEEMLGQDALQFIHPADFDHAARELHKILVTPGQSMVIELRCLHKDGSTKWLELIGTNRTQEPGVEAIVVNYRDITTRKQAEQGLREAEEKYRALVENLPAVVFMDVFNDPSHINYMSPRIKDLLGYTPEEWEAGDSIWENSLHPDDRERVLAEDARTDETGEPFRIEYRLLARDGHYVWIKEDAFLIRGEDGTPRFWQGVLLDITEHKKAEEALARRESILRAVGYAAEQFLKTPRWEDTIEGVLAHLGEAAQASRVYVFRKTITPEKKTLVSQQFEWCDQDIEPQIDNPSLQNMDLDSAGYNRWIRLFNDELPAYGIVKELPPEEQVEFLAEGILSLACVPIFVMSDWWGFIGFDDCKNERTWSSVEIEALRAAANALGTAIHRKLSEETLSNTETSYRGLFNSVRDAIYIQDEHGIFLDVNDGAVEMYGYPKEFFIGKTPAFLSAPGKNDLEEVDKSLQRAFQGEPQYLEFWGMRRNGEIFPKDVRLYKGSYIGRDVIIAIAQDITERKQAQEILERRMEELLILHDVTSAASSSSNEDELIESVTKIIGETLYPNNCGVELVDEARGIIKPHPSYRGISAGKRRESLTLSEGIVGKVAVTGRTLRVGDVSREPAYVEATLGVRSELCVPIQVHNQIIGVLNVESVQPAAFNEADERLLNTIAGTLATAMERLRLIKAERRRLQELTLLNTVASVSSQARSLDELIENTTRIIGESLYSDNFGFLLLDETNNYLRLHPSCRGIPSGVPPEPLHVSQGVSGQVVASKKPMRISDVGRETHYVGFTPDMRSELCIPIMLGERVLGVINAESSKLDAFSEEDEGLLVTIASTLANAMEKLRLFEVEQRRRQQAEILREVTVLLTSSLELEKVYNTILDSTAKLVPYTSASIELINQEYTEIVAQRGLPEKYHFVGNRSAFQPDTWRINPWNPVIIPDVRTDQRFIQFEGTEYIRSWLSVPLIVQDKLIGFLNLDSDTPAHYTEEHAALVQTFANQAATTIENARLYHSEQKRRQESENLRLAATAVTSSLEPQQVLETILVALQQVVPYDSASILQLEAEFVRITAAKGLPDTEGALNRLFPGDNALLTEIRLNSAPLILEDCRMDSRFEIWAASKDVRGWMGVPLIARGQVIGFITLDSYTPAAFSEKDAELAQTFALQAAAALENSRLYDETRHRLEELEVVSHISFALRTARDSEEMLPILLNEIIKSVDTDTAAIWLYEVESSELIKKASSGFFNHIPKHRLKPDEGIVGRVYTSGEPHMSADFSKDPLTDLENASDFGKEWGGITVPIQTSTETIGVLLVAVPLPRCIEPHQVRLIKTIAEIAGNAIHRTTLFGRSEEQIRRLTTFRDVDIAIASSFDLHVTMNILTDHLLTKLGVSAAALLMNNPESQTMTYLASAGFRSRDFLEFSQRVGEGLAGQILLNRKDIYVEDLRNETGLPNSDLIAREEFRSYYGLLLHSKGLTTGILEVYFRHPFKPTADWIDFIQTLAGQASIAVDNASLFDNLQRTNQELILAYDTTLEGWGKALELKDKETEGHTRRVTELTLKLAGRLGIPDSDQAHIRRGVLVHDIGKMGVPDNILNKEEALSEEEWVEMRRHPQYAYDLLHPISYLRPALDIAYHHHEWWDGSGYPLGLKGKEIPLPARIFAVVDVWDALLSDRPYRKAWPRIRAVKYIRELSGQQFDPRIVEAFMQLIGEDGEGAALGPGKVKKPSPEKAPRGRSPIHPPGRKLKSKRNKKK